MMKRLGLLLLLTLLPVAGISAEAPVAASGDRAPESAIRKYAGDAHPGKADDFGLVPVHDNEIFAVFRGDRLEYQTQEGEAVFLWDVQAWVGSDYNKLWFKSEGVMLADEATVEEADLELLYSRNIATFWDFQAGIRHDIRPEPTRTFAAVGLEGLAPYWFEVESTAYISEDGDISATIEAEYDLLLTQRLILQPRLETSIAVQSVEEYGVGEGFNDIEIGLRLRYEMHRKLAPYVGVSWSRKLGETADLAEAEGEDIDVASLVVGIKFWF